MDVQEDEEFKEGAMPVASFHISTAKMSVMDVLRLSSVIRKRQSCLTTVVDLQNPRDFRSLAVGMTKAMLLARTSDADKRRIIVTNYGETFLPFVPDPQHQVQQEPIILLNKVIF